MSPNVVITHEMKDWLDAPIEKSRSVISNTYIVGGIIVVAAVVLMVLEVSAALLGLTAFLLFIIAFSWAFERWKLSRLDVAVSETTTAWLAQASSQLEVERRHVDIEQYFMMTSCLLVGLVAMFFIVGPYLDGEFSFTELLWKLVQPILAIAIGARRSWVSEPARLAKREGELAGFRQRLAAPSPQASGLASW